MLEDQTAVVWRWLPDVLIGEVEEDLSKLTGRELKDVGLSSQLSPVLLFIDQLAGNRVHVYRRSIVKFTYKSQEYEISVPESAPLLEAVAEEVKKVDSELEPVDLVLRTSNGAALVGGAEIPEGSIEVSVPTTITIQFKYNDRTFSHEFELAATVADALEFVVSEIKAEPETAVLFYAGKELKPVQRLSRLRLKPGSCLIACVRDASPVLLQSAKGLQVRPRSFRFVVAERAQEFTLEFRPTDLIDRVLTSIADRLSVDRSCVSIWFNDRLLDEDVMLEVLSLGLNEVLEVRVQDAPTAALLSSLRASRYRAVEHAPTPAPVPAPPLSMDDDEISEAEEQAYAAIALSELCQLREIAKANKVVRRELELIELFLECGKDFNKFRIRLTEDSTY
jgi:hypothetical protein